MSEIKETLEHLFKNGLLNPESVVDHARNVDSPLHSHFDWDDTEAAHKWRIAQARTLIRSVKIQVDKSVPVMVRAFVSLPSDQVTGGGYRKIEEVLSNEFMVKQLTHEIRSKIEHWERKASEIGVILDFDSIKGQLRNVG